MFKKTLTIGALLVGSTAYAEEVPIIGNVQSKCSIFTDTAGVYGNPTPDVLSTASVDGGVTPIIRYDVALADSYTAAIAWPMGFSSSPTLNDAQDWSGQVELGTVSDAQMSGYEAVKVEYDNVTEYGLEFAGSAWFKVTSEMAYGYGKTLPGGEYKAMITAECIAN
tara:strand:+ start:1946 stop:2443 length:498 start_codon:yes stop_codon:yes gene_type:complete